MPSENRQNHLETGQTRSKKYGSIPEFHLLSPSSAPGQHGLTAALSQQEGSCFSKLSARLFGNTIPFCLLNTRGTPGRSWNAEDLLGALARCHGTQENQGAKGKGDFLTLNCSHQHFGAQKIPCFSGGFQQLWPPTTPTRCLPPAPQFPWEWGRRCHPLS